LFGVPVLAVPARPDGIAAVGEPLTGPEVWVPAVVTMVVFVWDMPTLAWAGMWYSGVGPAPANWLAPGHPPGARGAVAGVPRRALRHGGWSWTAVAVLWLLICGINNHSCGPPHDSSCGAGCASGRRAAAHTRAGGGRDSAGGRRRACPRDAGLWSVTRRSRSDERDHQAPPGRSPGHCP